MDAKDSDLSNEAAALTDILQWSADIPAWQRDALRRLCSQAKLEPVDVTSLAAICKAAEQGQPLDATHVRDPAASHAVVTLGALHGLSNVNALASGERLSFGKTGLTVIYGDNGAGKSGYARVLKQLCRARSPKGDAILPNIYAASSGTPSANVEFYIGGQKRNASWTQGSAADAMLSAVSVFDSRTANVHVENTNDLAYTPLPLRILAGLAQACQDVKAKLAAEIKALQDQTPAILSTPDCQPHTDVGKLLAALSGKTKAEAVEKLAGLNVEEDARLQATPVLYRLISRGGENSGFCHQDPPASVMPLDKVIEGMKVHLGNVKIHHERGDQAKWLREVTSFQDQLRTTWERAVEEVVGPVLRRLSRKVDTTGLIKLTVIADTDCIVMREAFGRCSALLHSQPGEINQRLPAPSIIQAEIEALEKWIIDIRQRQEKAA